MTSHLPGSPTKFSCSSACPRTSCMPPTLRHRPHLVLRTPRMASATFSSTVRSANTLEIWKVRPTPFWVRSGSARRVMSSPKHSITPLEGVSTPLMQWNSEVLPAPLGPMMTRRSPGATSRLTSLTARNPPKSLVTA